MAVSTAGMVARRRFGQALRSARENARHPDGRPIMQIDAARAIKRKTIDRVSRLERGAAWPEPNELEALLRLYDADLETSTRLRTMLKEGQAIASAWWQEYEDGFPESLIQFIAYEDAARSLTVIAVNAIPALPQTEAYARAVTAGVAGNFLTPEMVDRAVALRRRRRGIFTKPNPARVEFIMSQAALRQVAGSRRVMAEQLQAVLKDAEEFPVTLRVIPFDSPTTVMHIQHLLEFDGAEAKPIVALDGPTGLTLQTGPKETREARSIAENMRQLSLNPHDSTQLIRDIEKRFSSAQHD